MNRIDKYYRVVENKDIAEVIRIAKIILGVEDVIEELFLDLGIDYSGYRIEYIDKDLDEVHVYVNIGRECYKEKLVEKSAIKVMCRQTTPNTNEVYSYIALKLTEISINLLKPFLNKRNEYMAILLDEGIAIVLEGSPKKVTLPQIPGTIFACHTHPGTLTPIFSRDDVRSLLDILSSRGFGSCVLSGIACFTMFRHGPFLLEDYFRLFNVVKEYEYLDEVLMRSLHLESVDGFLLPT